ncbi:hypothetical protein BC940DRAFT_313113 [Gongronella butleri]|nr:hypothetical protein BC940DRAFT_313113 [Gongronella butleri]
MNMNDNLAAHEYTFWRPCKDDGVCYCDWRLTVTHCYGELVFQYINYVIIALSSVIIVIGCGILYYRVVKLGQVIFEYRNHYMRPRAMESIIFFMIIHNIIRLAQATVLVTDAAQNIIFRQFMFEIGYEVGFTTLGVYFFGIVHALRESDRAIFDQWIGSQRTADVISTTLIVAPYITNQICSFGAGINAYHGNFDEAEIFIKALYLVWCGHCFALATTTVFAGWRLISILNKHIKRKEQMNASFNVSKVKLGATKVRIIAYSSSFFLYSYIAVAGAYAVVRVPITENFAANLFFCICWNGIPILLSFIVSTAVILNPRMKLSLLFSSESRGQRSQDMELNTSMSAGFGSSHDRKKHMKRDPNATLTDASQTSGMFQVQTFDHGQYDDKLHETLEKYTQFSPMEAAPTLSSAIAKKYYGQSPLMVDEQDMEFVPVYPDSNRSSTQLVKQMP